jgi:hypothetical protein
MAATGFSDYMEKVVCEWLFKSKKTAAAAQSMATAGIAALSMSLHTGDTGDTGLLEVAHTNAYERGFKSGGTQAAGCPADVDDASGAHAIMWTIVTVSGTAQGVTNATTITFPTCATAAWNGGTAIQTWGFFDNATYGAGNFIMTGTITGGGVSVTVGVTLSFTVGNLSFNID